MKPISLNKAQKSSNVLKRFFRAACALNDESMDAAAKKLNYANSSTIRRVLGCENTTANLKKMECFVTYIIDAFQKHIPSTLSNELTEYITHHLSVVFAYKQQFRKKEIK